MRISRVTFHIFKVTALGSRLVVNIFYILITFFKIKIVLFCLKLF